MSHQPERIEKDCLNCGAIVEGRYCQVCGQENVVTKQNFWSLAKHFVFDIFHFDGKFFDTLRYLFFNPGKVPKEYVAGKRMTYLDPIRMYLFTSAFFFLIFFTFSKPKVTNKNEYAWRLGKAERLALGAELNERRNNGTATVFELDAFNRLFDSTYNVYLLKPEKRKDSLVRFEDKLYRFAVKKQVSAQSIDSNLHQQNWFARQMKRKAVKLEKQYNDNDEGVVQVLEVFVHRIPYMLFLSLPFFALILRLLYARRKNFVYSDHVVFTLYHYIFSFLLLLVAFGISTLADYTDWGIFTFILFGLAALWAVYLYKGMRVFYGQSRKKTVGKFLLLNVLGFVVIILLLLLFILLTAFQI